MFYSYGYQYWDGKIYKRKDTGSGVLSCFLEFHLVKRVIELPELKKVDIKQNDKNYTTIYTNQEYKIKHNGLVTYESELIVVFIILLCITFIFKEWILIWTFLIIIFFICRKKLRDKWNG